MTRRHATCPVCKRRFRVEPGVSVDPQGQGPFERLVDLSDIFPEHADVTNGGWCAGSRWLVEEEEYASEAP